MNREGKNSVHNIDVVEIVLDQAVRAEIDRADARMVRSELPQTREEILARLRSPRRTHKSDLVHTWDYDLVVVALVVATRLLLVGFGGALLAFALHTDGIGELAILPGFYALLVGTGSIAHLMRAGTRRMSKDKNDNSMEHEEA
jgi:hypothetical protein